MATKLEAVTAVIRYGTGGPDKWAFIQKGILDERQDRTDHTFTIDGRRVDICITDGRPIPSWQCPRHPGILEERHDYGWADAWEFSGFGDGCAIRGIYSLRSRHGVFHFWKLHVAQEGCPSAQRDMHLFFSGQANNSEAMLALARAMKHMSRGSALGGYYVDCADCWGLFRTLRDRSQGAF